MKQIDRLSKLHDVDTAMLVFRSIINMATASNYTGRVNLNIDLIDSKLSAPFKVFNENRDIFEPMLKAHGFRVEKWDIKETIIWDNTIQTGEVPFF